MASKAKKKHMKQNANSMIDSLDPNICVFCKKQEDNEDFLGKLIRKCNLTVHYFCMLFSSGLGQGGKTEDDGVLGFLPQDILKEVSRGRRLRCTYCKQKGATVGCVVSSCRRVFHLNCGRQSGTLHQFYDSYRSYCEEHRPRQKNPVSDRLSFYGTANTLCAICMMSVEARASNETLRAPCCRNSWFHRTCIQRHSTAAGLHFFKCPLCNNKEMFQAEMLKYGIYLPDQDAAWEREPNAFNELLERYTHCDAARCKCAHGRDYNKDGGKWEIIVCDWCGSTGTHVDCHSLHKIGSNNVCADCKFIDDKSRKETGLPKRKKVKVGKHTPKNTESENNLSENKGKSEYPGSSGLLRKATPPLKRKFASKKKAVSPGTVLRLSYEETDDNVVVDGDESDEEDIVLSELAKKDNNCQTDRKRKKTFRYNRCNKKLRSSVPSKFTEFSFDETESDSSFHIGNKIQRPTSQRRSFASATVTRETTKIDTNGNVQSLSATVPSKHQSVEDLRKKKQKLKMQRKYNPFVISSRKKHKKSNKRFNGSVSSIDSQDTSSSAFMTLDPCCSTDDSQFGDSESNIFLSESEMDASFSSQCRYKKNRSLLVKSKGNVYPSVSTPISTGSLERKLSLRNSPTKIPCENLKSLSINALSPVKSLTDTRSSADSNSEDTLKKENKSKISSDTNSDGNISAKKLVLDQAGKEKVKTKRKYNKLKKESNQMSIKLWLHGSPKENDDKTDKTNTSDVKSTVKKNKQKVFRGGEQRKTLVIKWKGKRFIVRRTIKDNITIRKTLEIDGKSPEKLRVKPLTREKLRSNYPVKFASFRELEVSKISVEQETECKTPTKQLRSNTKYVQKESHQKSGDKNTTAQAKTNGNSSVNRKKNDTLKDFSTSPSPSKIYPTRRAVSNQKTNAPSLIDFPDEMLYFSPKKGKSCVHSNVDNLYSKSPNRIKIKSDQDSSVISSLSDTSAMTREVNDSVVILDANDNITHVATSEQEQDRFESRKSNSEEDIIIIHDNSLNRSKVKGAELSPVGDTYRCLIVDFGGNDLTDSDFQSAQYVNLSLQNKKDSLLDKMDADSPDTVPTLSSCLLKSFDKNGIQQLNVVVSDTK